MAEVVRPFPIRAALFILCFNVFQAAPTDASRTWRTSEAHHNILSVDSSCTKDGMDVRIGFASSPEAPPFRGAIHAKGFPRECQSSSALNTTIQDGSSTSRVVFLTLRLPAESCGVSVISREDGLLAYQVEVDIQFDRNLQQSVDQSRTITCTLPQEATQISGNQAINPEQSMPQRRRNSYRSGRKDDLGSGAPPRGIQAWMEVHGMQKGGGKLPRHRTYSVGEHLTMSVKSFLPMGIGARVINCTAHDGRVNGPEQRLLDSKGCPLDAGIMPAPTSYRRNIKRNGNASQRRTYPSYEAATSFLAFKFPDRDFLHLRCWLRICKGLCKQVNCSTQEEYFEETYEEDDENEITRVEVFNSLSVRAPSIEVDATQLDSFSRKDPVSNTDEKAAASGRLLCMSPSKLALAFAVLGIIFLVAIAISIYVCLRSRHRKGWQGRRISYFAPPSSLSRSSSNASFLPNHRSSCPLFRSSH